MSNSHSKFKAFISPGTSSAQSRAGAELWSRELAVNPVSLGVEYVEPLDRLVLTVGYQDAPAPVPVRIEEVNMGRLDLVPEAIERALAHAASSVSGDVICHEFYVTGDGLFNVLFLLKA